MSNPSEGGAVVTTDQIYTELRSVSETLLKLKVKFEIVDDLKDRIAALERQRDEDQRNRWQLPTAWTAAAASMFAAIWQAFHH